MKVSDREFELSGSLISVQKQLNEMHDISSSWKEKYRDCSCIVSQKEVAILKQEEVILALLGHLKNSQDVIESQIEAITRLTDRLEKDAKAA